jgi:carboxyl-terminal processing protease
MQTWIRIVRLLTPAIATFTVLSAPLALPSLAGERQEAREAVRDAWEIVDRTYLDIASEQANWAEQQQLFDRDYTSLAEAYDAIQVALESLGDPYTRVLPPESPTARSAAISEEIAGSGLHLQIDTAGRLRVATPPPLDSPAFAAGLRSRDWIAAIEGHPTAGINCGEVLRRQLNSATTPLTLAVRRNGSTPLQVEIPLRVKPLPTVSYSVKSLAHRQLGYIRLRQFDKDSGRQVRDAIRNLEDRNVSGYILDLRANSGGLLDASTDIAQLFLEQATIVTIEDRTGIQQIRAESDALTDKPLAVLVDRGSASASEILAGALQDAERANLVGTRTFGKGLVQSVHPLPGDGYLAVTVARYRTPEGRDIHHHGLQPNLTVELSQAAMTQLASHPEAIATSADPQFAEAARWLETKM